MEKEIRKLLDERQRLMEKVRSELMDIEKAMNHETLGL